jgi:hypothetical protein
MWFDIIKFAFTEQELEQLIIDLGGWENPPTALLSDLERAKGEISQPLMTEEVKPIQEPLIIDDLKPIIEILPQGITPEKAKETKRQKWWNKVRGRYPILATLIDEKAKEPRVQQENY